MNVIIEITLLDPQQKQTHLVNIKTRRSADGHKPARCV